MKIQRRFPRPLRRSLHALLAIGLPVFGHAAPASASPVSPGPPITTAADFWLVPMAERNSPHAAELAITATYYDPIWRVLWGYDRRGESGYFPVATGSTRIRSGQRFLVSGPIIPAEGLPLATAKITLLPDPPPVEPLSAQDNFADFARFNGRLVTVEAYVNSQAEVGLTHLVLALDVAGISAIARVLVLNDSPLPQVSGAFIRLTGVYVFDGSAPPVHPILWVPRPENIEITGWLDRDPRFNLPVTPSTSFRPPSVPRRSVLPARFNRRSPAKMSSCATTPAR